MMGKREVDRPDPPQVCFGRGGSDLCLGLRRNSESKRLPSPVVLDVLTGCLSRVHALGILISAATGMAMTLSTADISIQLLMDTMNALQEIESRVTARAFAAVMDPTKGPEVRDVLAQLLAVLDETSSDGVI